MNSTIHHLTTRRRIAKTEALPSGFRNPNYECRDHGDALRLTVYVPGVDPSGIEITGCGPDLLVSARKAHFVRVNFEAFHLETAQKDYLLKLRLGHHLDFGGLSAEIHDSILTICVPKKSRARGLRTAHRMVA